MKTEATKYKTFFLASVGFRKVITIARGARRRLELRESSPPNTVGMARNGGKFVHTPSELCASAFTKRRCFISRFSRKTLCSTQMEIYSCNQPVLMFLNVSISCLPFTSLTWVPLRRHTHINDHAVTYELIL